MKKQLFLLVPLFASLITTATANALSCPNLNESQVLELSEPLPAMDSYILSEPTQAADGSCSYGLSSSSGLMSAGKEGLLKIKVKSGMFGALFGARCPSLAGFKVKFEQPLPAKTPYEITATDNKCNFRLMPHISLEEKGASGSLKFIEEK